jgi:hypothetical protein
MSADNEEAMKEAEEARKSAKPNAGDAFNIKNDARRHKSPEIARFRSVVERVIRSMKNFKLLMNVDLISKMKVKFLQKILFVVAAISNYNLKQRKSPY